MNRSLLAGGLLVLLALWFAALAARPLFNPDEGRYAEIPREMLTGGDWVVPHLNGLAYIEKPPLQYWATAVALAVFGDAPWAARLYASLCAFACVAAVTWTARRLWGVAAAWQAGAVSASLLLFLVLGHVLTLDMSLSCWMTGSLCAFLLAQQHAQQGRTGAARRAMIVAWACAALGVMTKGLVAAVIPAAVLVLYTALRRDFSPWRRLHLLPGLGLFLLITVPWHVLAQRRLPDFVEFFFIREHFARFMTPVADREEPAWFFVVMFMVGTLPWTAGALRALACGWRRKEAEFDAPAFLRLWVLFILLFFSLSDSKLIPYILPALPALGLLLAAQPASLRRRDAAQASFLMLMAGLLLAAVAATLPWWLKPDLRTPYFLELRMPASIAATLLLAAGLWGWYRRRSARDADVMPSAAGWIAAVLVLLLGASVLAPIYSGARLAQALPLADRATSPLFSVRTYDQSLPFYWRRTLTLVDYRGELDYGLRHDPQSAICSLEAFTVRWRQLERGFAVMEPDTLTFLQQQGLPMHIVARDVHRVLVSRQ